MSIINARNEAKLTDNSHKPQVEVKKKKVVKKEVKK